MRSIGFHDISDQVTDGVTVRVMLMMKKGRRNNPHVKKRVCVCVVVVYVKLFDKNPPPLSASGSKGVVCVCLSLIPPHSQTVLRRVLSDKRFV